MSLTLEKLLSMGLLKPCTHDLIRHKDFIIRCPQCALSMVEIALRHGIKLVYQNQRVREATAKMIEEDILLDFGLQLEPEEVQESGAISRPIRTHETKHPYRKD